MSLSRSASPDGPTPVPPWPPRPPRSSAPTPFPPATASAVAALSPHPGSRPDLPPAPAPSRRRIQRQHRMHKQIRNPTVAAWPKTAPGATQKAQVRGILDRQNMPPPWPACPRPSPRRPLPTSPPGSTETFQIPPCKPDRAQACAQSNFVPRQDGLPEEPPFCPPLIAKAVPEHLPEMQAHETLQRASNEPSESSSQTPRNHPLTHNQKCVHVLASRGRLSTGRRSAERSSRYRTWPGRISSRGT